MSDVSDIADVDKETPGSDLRRTPPVCPNCSAELHGTWCYACGQNQKPVDRFFFSLVSEAFEDVLAFDSRAAKTIAAVLFRPGFLTREYFAGRRARYVPPLRLYLITSIIYFFLLSTQLISRDDMDTSGVQVTLDDETKALVIDDEIETPESIDIGTNKSDEWIDDLNAKFDEIQFDSLSDDTNASIRNRLKLQTEKLGKIIREDPSELLDALIDVAPPVMFMLLPLFALLLKLTYLGSGRFYTEHLVLAVHNHSFLYIALSLDGLARVAIPSLPALDYLSSAIQIYIPIYMFLALKSVYQESTASTVLKYIFLLLSYNVMFLIALLVAFLLGVMTL